MKKFKLGIQLFGLRNSMAEDFEGTLKKVAEMGYEYVEFAGYFDHTSEEIKAILDKYNLKCVSVHQRLEFFDENPEEKIAFLKGFGVKYNVIPWYAKEELAGTDKWEDTIKTFNKYGKLLKDNGLLMGYHNHEFEFTKYKGKTLHNYIFDTIDKDIIFPELDLCWVKYGGEDPCDRIRHFAGRIPIIHFKDFTCEKLAGGPAYDLIDENGNPQNAGSRDDNKFEFRPLGQGMQDFDPIFKACEEAGVEVIIVEQDKVYGGMTELEAAKISIDFLKEKIGL